MSPLTPQDADIPRMRVHEIASSLGISSAIVLEALESLGEFVKSPSAYVQPPVTRRALVLLGRAWPDKEVEPAEPRPQTPQPQASEYGWHSGAVKPPVSAGLEKGLAAAQVKLGIIDEHRRLLTHVGSQIVSAFPSKDRGLAGCFTLLIRFSGAIESAFGLTREVLAVYTPYSDLHTRTFEAGMRELRSNNSATPDVILFYAPDPRLSDKLSQWGQLQTVAIPFQLDSADALAIVDLFQDHIHVRNLFDTAGPVVGATFFGRRTVLQALREDVLAQRTTGIFGLRKAGKTSILLQLAHDLKQEKILPVLIDLESLPSPPIDPTDDFLALLRVRLIEELKAAKLRVRELSDLPNVPSPMQFKLAMQKLLRAIASDGTRVLLMLDEIEYLTPLTSGSATSVELPRVAQMLSVLRSITQESGNMSLLVAGLTSAIVEDGVLHGRPNPFFSWARTVYVGPLDKADADNLARSLGRRMGIFVSEDALEALYEASGGHAYLYRNLAAAVVNTLPVKAQNRAIGRRDVLRALNDWRVQVHSRITEMIRHVERYYPTEAVLLAALRDDPELYREFAASEVEAAGHLRSLGLIEVVDGIDRQAAILELL